MDMYAGCPSVRWRGGSPEHAGAEDDQLTTEPLGGLCNTNSSQMGGGTKREQENEGEVLDRGRALLRQREIKDSASTVFHG